MAMKGLATAMVDAALVQRAMGELGIRVPVRGWVVKRGRLVLLLATGERMVWEERKGKGGQDARAPRRGRKDAGGPEEER
jgi:hypothetical protein